MQVPGSAGLEEAKMYVDNRSGSLHEAFNTPSRYDDQRAQFIPKTNTRLNSDSILRNR